ncbi:hypothetical protein [Teredinibacter haidensis]|uniref:hypothetical protein n=1 Tax=Teredinibacter haidensis TaxID=2731755 RepID=UPI00163C385E|nr:hypothetical protein [Teredinibacter haidensis]
MDTMHHIAEKLGWQVVSKRYNGTLKPLKWRCDKGHEFSMLPRNVLQKTSCPICNPRKHTLNEMQVVAKERGGQCLSKVYENVNTKMRWRCQHGHEWDALPSSILQGAWCRECRKTTVAKAQTARRINNQKKAKTKPKTKIVAKKIQTATMA